MDVLKRNADNSLGYLSNEVSVNGSFFIAGHEVSSGVQVSLGNSWSTIICRK